MKIFTTPLTAHAIAITADLVAARPRDIDKKIFVFCESKATLSFEKAIVQRLGGTFNVEVMSFSRYVSKNVRVNSYLSKAQSALLVRKLMLENQSALYRIKPNAFSVPSDVYGLISQLKAAMVTPEDLATVVEKEGGAFGSKLKDIATVYGLYEDYLNANDLTDESKYLSLMTDVVSNDPSIKGAYVLVSAIQSYTKQTVEILKALSKVADLNFVCVSADFPSFTNESVNKISGVFKNAEVIPLREESKSLQYEVGKCIFEPTTVTGSSCNGKIKITETASVKDECDKISARIRYEVVNNGLRYRDFSVICPDVKSLAPILRESFYLYDIPLYVDDAKTLDEHPVIGLIGGLIDLKRFNLLPKKALVSAKNGLLCSYQESLEFSSYVCENAISRKQMKEPFANLIAESVRSRLVFATEKFKSSDTVFAYVDAIRAILDYLGVYERGKVLSDGLNQLKEGVTAEYNDGALTAFEQFLDEIKGVLGSVKVSLNEFRNIIFSAAKAVTVATVPEYNDTVFLGDYRSGRIKDSKILFMPCLTASVPSTQADVALLNDRELFKMDGYKLVVEPKLKLVTAREKENIVVSAMSFTDRLYLSYSTTDKSGKQTLKSEIIDEIAKRFSLVEKKDGTAAEKPYDTISPYNFMSCKAGVLYSAKKAEDFMERKTDDLKDLSAFSAVALKGENANLLRKKEGNESDIYNNDLRYDGKFSPTQIETYFDCPYKAFAQNVLKLKEADDGETKVYEIGNVLHAVMEKFVDNYAMITDENSALDLAGKLFDEEIKTPLYARYLNKPQYKASFKLMGDEAKKVCLKIYRDLKKSDFKPYGTEVEFNESAKNGFTPIYLETPSGKIPIRGKIDRVDFYSDGFDNYFRIIDYKTGSIKSEDGEFYCGKKIQLYLYMNVFAKNGYKPAGAYYLKLSDDFSSTGTDGGEYLGKSLADAEILKKLDNDLSETHESKNLGVKLSANGAITGAKSLLSADEFDKYLKYAKSVACSGVTEMSKGCFIPSPTETACDYCNFKGMCGYDAESGDNNRVVKTASKNSIISAEEEQ